MCSTITFGLRSCQVSSAVVALRVRLHLGLALGREGDRLRDDVGARRAPCSRRARSARRAGRGRRGRAARCGRRRSSAVTLAVVALVLGEPGLRDALLRPRQPGLDDEVVELLAVEPREVGDPHEHRRIVVEVRRREVDAAVVGEAGSASRRGRRRGTSARRRGARRCPGRRRRVRWLRWNTNALPCTVYAGRPSSDTSQARLGQRQRELVQVGHRRHGGSLPCSHKTHSRVTKLL